MQSLCELTFVPVGRAQSAVQARLSDDGAAVTPTVLNAALIREKVLAVRRVEDAFVHFESSRAQTSGSCP
jgi:hypothetical protein